MKNEPSFETLENNINALKEIAQKLGKRTSSDYLIDSQVLRSSWDWRDSLSGKPMRSDFLSRKVSFKTNDCKVTLRVNDEFLVAEIKGAFGDSVICSFVNESHVLSIRKLAPRSLCKNIGYKVYVDSSPHTESTIAFLINPSVQDIVKAFNFTRRESLHIGNGCASLYLQRFICDEVLKALDNLYKLLSLLPSAEETSINLEDLPEGFHKLIPLIKLWSISDDEERSEKISKASSTSLALLVDSLEPEYGEIDKYLASFKEEPLTDQAILLGNLAECSIEAKYLLEKRKAK